MMVNHYRVMNDAVSAEFAVMQNLIFRKDYLCCYIENRLLAKAHTGVLVRKLLGQFREERVMAWTRKVDIARFMT